MRLELMPRQAASGVVMAALRSGASSVLALITACVLGGVVVLAMGRSPLRAFEVYFLEPLSQGWAITEVLVKATPLIIVAVGLTFCFRANRWNIGAEGQFVMGGLAGGAIAVFTHGVQGSWVLPLMLIAGTMAGMIYAAIPALLRNRFGVSEILTSLMLVYVAELFLDYCVRGPLRDPKGFNFPQSVAFAESAILPTLGEGGRLHLGVPIAALIVVLAAIVLSRTRFGFSIAVAGEAPRAARFAGFDEKRTTLAVFALSGALAGLAGIIEVSGQIGQLKPTISPGYGFTAIIVAFLGRLSPFGILLAGLVLALVSIGAEGAQVALKLPLDLARVFQGLLLFCILGADILSRYRVVLMRER